jgi:hypothetical protein
MRLHAARAGAVLGDAGQLDAAIAIRHQIDVEDQPWLSDDRSRVLAGIAIRAGGVLLPKGSVTAVSSNLEPAVREPLPKVILGFFCDLNPVLLVDLRCNFPVAANVPVDGTNHSIVGFRVPPEMFDAELRAALRARRLNIQDRNEGDGH